MKKNIIYVLICEETNDGMTDTSVKAYTKKKSAQEQMNKEYKQEVSLKYDKYGKWNDKRISTNSAYISEDGYWNNNHIDWNIIETEVQND